MTLPDYTNCTLCPRMCHVNRHETTGYCGCSDHILAARLPFTNGKSQSLAGRKKNLAAAAPYFSPAVLCAAAFAKILYSARSILEKN